MGSNRPNVIGSKFLFQTPSETIYTNAIVDAVDSPISSTDIYPNAYSASMPDRTSHAWRSVATDLDLAAASRLSFGIFVPNSYLQKGNTIMSFKGTLNFAAEAASFVRAFPIIGRLSAAVPVVSTVAAANLLTYYLAVPMVSNAVHGGSSSQIIMHSYSVDCDFINLVGAPYYPVFGGWVIENISPATAWNLDNINASVSLESYIEDIDVYSPMGR